MPWPTTSHSQVSTMAHPEGAISTLRCVFSPTRDLPPPQNISLFWSREDSRPTEMFSWFWDCLSVFERVWEGGESPGKCWIVSLRFSSGTTVGRALTWIRPYFIVGICTYKLCIRKWGFVHMRFQAEDLFFHSGKFSAMLISFHVLNSILWNSCIHAEAWT